MKKYLKMKTIKFRAWDGDTMWEVREIDFDLERIYIGLHYEDISDVTLMQYTGLYDKNGTEIYEGDVLQTETDKLMVVSWSEKFASWCLDRSDWLFTHWFGEAVDSENCEIKGNIHENPELL